MKNIKRKRRHNRKKKEINKKKYYIRETYIIQLDLFTCLVIRFLDFFCLFFSPLFFTLLIFFLLLYSLTPGFYFAAGLSYSFSLPLARFCSFTLGLLSSQSLSFTLRHLSLSFFNFSSSPFHTRIHIFHVHIS